MDDEDNKTKLTVLQFKKPEQTETDADINPDKEPESAPAIKTRTRSPKIRPLDKEERQASVIRESKNK